MKIRKSFINIICIILVTTFVTGMLPAMETGVTPRAAASELEEELPREGILRNGEPNERAELPEAEDLDALLQTKGDYLWSWLTDNERNIVMSEYGISSYIMEQLETAGITLQRSIGCVLVLKNTTLTLDEVLLVNDSYEQLWDAVKELKSLERFANEQQLPVEEYSLIRESIINGSTLQEMMEFLGLDDPLRERPEPTRGDPPEPSVDMSFVAPFSLQNGENESVSLNTGSLSLEYPIVSLPGINGMGVDLSVRYDSSTADLYDMKASAYYSYIYGFKEIYHGYYFTTTDGVVTGDGYRYSSLDLDNGDKWYSTSTAANTDFASYKNYYQRLSFMDHYSTTTQSINISNYLGFTRSRSEEYDAVTGKPTYNFTPWVPPESTPVPTSISYNSGGYTGTLYETHRTVQEVPGPVQNGKFWMAVTWRVYFGGTAKKTTTYGTHYYIQAEPTKWPDGSYVTSKSVLAGYFATTGSPTYGQKTSDIGAGWSWNIPSYDTSNRVLHLANGSTLELNSNLTFKDHPVQDMVFSTGAGFTSNGLSASYKLSYIGGTTVWFYSDGRCLGVSDRFDNKIYYQYTTGPNGYRLSKIIDAVARETNITYQTGSVTVTAPDNKATVIALTTQSSRNILQSITPPSQPSTVFEYSYDNAPFYINGCGSANNTSANLVRVNHPTGGKTQYAYSSHQEGIGSGYSTVYKLSSRKDLIGSTEYAARTYTNYGKYTGYPTYSKQSDLPTTYTYTVTVTEANGVNTVFTFNNYGMQTISDTKSGAGVQIAKQLIQYDAYRLPVKVASQQYNSQGNYMETIDMTEFDSMGRMIYSWSPLAEGVKSDEYKTTYTYSNTYSLLLSVSGKQAPARTVSCTYTLTPDSKAAEYVELFENGVPKQKTKYAYNPKGQITEKYDYKDDFISFVLTSYGYDAWGNVNVISTAGVQDSSGANVTSPSFASGTVGKRYVYDIAGRLLSETDENGNTVNYQYDGAGRLHVVSYPGNAQIEYVRDYVANTLTVTDLLGTVTRYEYDQFGNELYVRDMSNMSILSTKTYDSMFRLSTSTGPSGAATISFGYDLLGRVVSSAAVKSAVTLASETYAYDDAALVGGVRYAKTTKTVVGEANAPDIVTTQYVDKMGNVARTGYFIGGIEYFDVNQYDYAGNMIQSLSALDSSNGRAYTAKWEYDYAGRVIKETNTLGQYTLRTFDALGRNVTCTDYAGSTSTFTYDALGRLLSQESPFEQAGGTVYYSGQKYDYDPAGHVIREQVKNNIPGQAASWSKTEYSYNNRGFLESALSYDAQSVRQKVQYQYDNVGNIRFMTTGISPQDYAVTEYTYDRFGFPATMTDALTQQESYVVDPAGNMLSKLDRNGALTTCTYDGLNRLRTTDVVKDNANIGTAETTYTLTGQAKTSSNSDYSASFSYDALGRLITESETGGVVKGYTYDIGGNRTSLAVSVNNTAYLNASYEYDELSRLKYVKENGVTQATYTYDINGNRDTLTYINGNVTTYAYNLANMVTSLQNKNGNNVRSSYAYTYYLDGNQRTKTDQTGLTSTYLFDGLGRLTQEAESGIQGAKTYVYAYDARGNRDSLTVSGAESYSVDYSYDLNNRLNSTVKNAGSTAETTEYRYDPNGNTISQVTETLSPASVSEGQLALGGDGWELSEYNGFNQLVKTHKDGVDVEYAYKPDGLRLTKSTNGVSVRHIWDGQNIVSEITGNAVSDVYLRGLNLIYAQESGAKTFYSFNAHGDVVQLTDASGAVTIEYRYDAFGNDIGTTQNGGGDSTDSNSFRFASMYFDIDIGKYMSSYRHYVPSIGRWTQEDPIRSGLNWYTYCSNSPIMFIDPLGLADVLARAFLEERGAEVNWTSNETRNGTTYANATVKYNGSSYTVSGALVNGSMVCDDADLNRIFGWTSTVYYFFGSDQQDHATSNIKDLRSNNYAVISTLFTSTSAFNAAYNAMPATVDIVIINQHGDPWEVSYVDLSKMDMTKSIGTFVLLSCNAGHLWTGSDSIALQIADASNGNINQLISCDGTHSRGRFWNPFRGVAVSGDGTWKGYIDPSLGKSAKSQGFISYQWNGTSYDQTSIGKSFSSVRSLLKKVGA